MKVNKYKTKLFLQIMLFLIPVGFISNKVIKLLWYGMLSISLVLILFQYLNSYKKIIWRNTMVSVMFFYLIMQTFSTLYNCGNWLYNLFTAFIICASVLFCEMAIRKNMVSFIQMFDLALGFSICLELVTHAFGNQDYFMDFASTYVYYGVWSTIHLMNLWQSRKKDYYLYIISFAAVLITIIKPQIGGDGAPNYEWTFYIMVILMCFVYLFRSILYRLGKLINIFWVYFMVMTLNLVVVFYQIVDRIFIVRFLVEDIMHKDITFTGRTGIWQMTLSYIKRNPIIGYGTGLSGIPDSNDYWIEFLRIRGPHNQFLYIWLAGGIITLILYILLMLKNTWQLYKYRRYACSVIISIGLFTIYLELLMTFRNIINCIPLFILFVIGNNVPIMLEEQKNKWRNSDG